MRATLWATIPNARKKMGVWDFFERSIFNGETNYHFDTSSN